MAPADTPRRKNRESNYTNIGVQGRKTGITVKDTGVRDEHGLEVIDGLFSSPEKLSPKKKTLINSMTITSEEDMDIGQSTIPEPTEVLTSQRLSRTSKALLPPPRSRSPIKTSLNSPARRQASLGPVSSPSKVANGTPSRASSHPAVHRRLDFSMSDVRPSVENTPSASINRSQQKFRQSQHSSPAQKYVNGGNKPTSMADARLQSPPGKGKRRGLVQTMRLEESEAEEDEEDGYQVDEVMDDINVYNEESIALQNGEDSTQFDQINNETLTQPDFGDSQLVQDDEEAPSQLPKRRGRPKKTANSEATHPEPPTGPAQTLKRGRGKAQPINATNVAPLQEDEQVEEDVTDRRPSKRARGKLAEPTTRSGKAKAPKPPPAQRGPNAKVTSNKKKPAEASKATKIKAEPKEKPEKVAKPLAKTKKPKATASGHRATPLEADGFKTTRSGRTLLKPLAFWRNEHVVYGRDDAAIPTIKEIVWKDPLDEPQQKPRVRRPKKPVKKPEPEGLDEEELETWEIEEGMVRGPVRRWDEINEIGVDPEDEDSGEEDLAFSSLSVETREVANSTFRYQKLLTLPFFGSGMVDLPRGGIKKPKNSRKMQMVFFVFYGRVQVTVGETEFRISQGGVWQVPRGNMYSITNDYDEPARIFFAQGCVPDGMVQRFQAGDEQEIQVGESAQSMPLSQPL